MLSPLHSDRSTEFAADRLCMPPFPKYAACTVIVKLHEKNAVQHDSFTGLENGELCLPVCNAQVVPYRQNLKPGRFVSQCVGSIAPVVMDSLATYHRVGKWRFMIAGVFGEKCRRGPRVVVCAGLAICRQPFFEVSQRQSSDVCPSEAEQVEAKNELQRPSAIGIRVVFSIT